MIFTTLLRVRLFGVCCLKERWLQDAVYAGFEVEVQLGWVLGRSGVIVSKRAPT